MSEEIYRQRLICSASGRAWAVLAFLFILFTPSRSTAQFLRVGPFDFTGAVDAGFTWSDNVDGLRPSQQDKRASDVYLELGFTMQASAETSRGTRMDISLGMTAEDYYHRDDLDEGDLGLVDVRVAKGSGSLMLEAWFTWENTYEMSDNIYFPGVSRYTRNPSTETEYGAMAEWQRDPLTLDAEYTFVQERYEKDEFKVGDNDKTTITMLADWKITSEGSISYEVEYERTKFVRDPDDEGEWRTTKTILFNQPLTFWERPEVTLRVGLEKEDQDDEEGEWDPVYTLQISDEWQLGPQLRLSADAEYEYDQDPETDDIIGWQYSVSLSHEVNARVTHELKFEREPRDTFNSTLDTETTEYTYFLTIRDILMPDLNFNWDLSYEINDPIEGLTEHITSSEMELSHTRPISPRLRRTFKYMYKVEDSDFYDELLIEHEVEWMYTYDL